MTKKKALAQYLAAGSLLFAMSGVYGNVAVDRLSHINQTPASSEPREFVEMDGVRYFAARTPEHGFELYRSSGANENTSLLKDIYPGSYNSNPRNLTVAEIAGQQRLFFTANDGEHGSELWVSDGSEAGTRMVKNIADGGESSMPRSLTPWGDGLAFAAFDESGEDGDGWLWYTEGDEASTVKLHQFNQRPSVLTVSGGVLYFRAHDDTHGYQLWRSDGTPAGTEMVKAIDWSNDNAQQIVADGGGGVYFVADDGDGITLWHSDGTETGTTRLADPAQIDRPMHLTMSDGVLYFYCRSSGHVLCKSDGTEAGTVVVANELNGASSYSPKHLVDLNGTLYFTAEDDVNGRQLWRSNGTQAGTTMVKKIGQGDSGNGVVVGKSDAIVVSAGKLWFAADDGVHGRELWVSDGTEAGTYMVTDIQPGGSAFTGFESISAVNNGVVFAADDSVHGIEPWFSAGADSTTHILRNIAEGTGNIDYFTFVYYSTIHQGDLYLTANDGQSGRELWHVGEHGAQRTLDINPGTASSDPRWMTSHGEHVYFSAYNEIYGRELWRSDGSGEGTELVKDIRPGEGSSSVQVNGVLGDKVLLAAYSDQHDGMELWSSDGTASGTRLLMDINPGGSSLPSRVLLHDGLAYFIAYDAVYGRQLWVTDGSAAGTRRLTSIGGGAHPTELRGITLAGGQVYFSADDGVNGIELWRYDIELEQAVMVRNIRQGGSSLPLQVTDIGGGRVVFSAFTDAHGRELWLSDGSEAGTRMLIDLIPGSESGGPSLITAHDGDVYFYGRTPSGDWHLYRMDMSDESLRQLTSVPSKFILGLMKVVADQIFFPWDDGEHGGELWATDGTAAGTRMVADILPGAGGSNPRLIEAEGNTLYFAANDGLHGQEIWRAQVTGGSSSNGDSGSGGGGGAGWSTIPLLALVWLFGSAAVRRKRAV